MRSIRRGPLSGKVLLSVLSVVLISFLFLTCVVSYWSYQKMAKEYTQVLQDYASGINSDFSRRMEKMSALTEKYYNSYNSKTMVNGDSLQLGKNVVLMTEVRREMEPFYHSVLFLNNKGKVCFDTRKGISYVDSLRECVEKMALEQDLGSRPFLWRAKNRYSNEPDINMLSLYLQRAPVGEKYYAGSVVINVDTAFLSQELFEDFRQENFEVYILDQNGCVAAHSDTSLLGQDLSKEPHVAEILKEGCETGNHKIPKNRGNMFYQSTEYGGFYVVVQSKDASRFFDVLGDMPLGLLLLDFVVSVILIYILCNIQFRSFNTVTAHMRAALQEEYKILDAEEDKPTTFQTLWVAIAFSL